MRRPRARRDLGREQVLAERDVVDAVFGREQAERVDDLPRVLLRPLVGGEEVRAVRDDRPADAAAELIAAVVLFVEVVDAAR